MLSWLVGLLKVTPWVTLVAIWHQANKLKPAVWPNASRSRIKIGGKLELWVTLSSRGTVEVFNAGGFAEEKPFDPRARRDSSSEPAFSVFFRISFRPPSLV